MLSRCGGSYCVFKIFKIQFCRHNNREALAKNHLIVLQTRRLLTEVWDENKKKGKAPCVGIVTESARSVPVAG